MGTLASTQSCSIDLGKFGQSHIWMNFMVFNSQLSIEMTL